VRNKEEESQVNRAARVCRMIGTCYVAYGLGDAASDIFEKAPKMVASRSL